MLAWAAIKAVAFLLNGAMFLVGIARMHGRLAPPDYLYVGLLLLTPLASAAALVLSYRKRLDPEVSATVKIAAVLLNTSVLLFVIWLAANLDPETRAEQGLWLVMLFAAPPANALAILPRRRSD
jgi:cytochrome bd-type quinol oxidase subunit 2